jgi:DHA2 family multidrug resistance protein
MPRWSFARFGTDWSDDPTAMPTARKFLIFGLMAFGQFLALFDIQIVSASQREVAAGSPPGRMKSAGCRPPT